MRVRRVGDDEEGDDDVLRGEEEVLAVGRKGIAVAVVIDCGYRVCKRLKNVCSEGQATGGTSFKDCFGVAQVSQEKDAMKREAY